MTRQAISSKIPRIIHIKIKNFRITFFFSLASYKARDAKIGSISSSNFNERHLIKNSVTVFGSDGGGPIGGAHFNHLIFFYKSFNKLDNKLDINKNKLTLEWIEMVKSEGMSSLLSSQFINSVQLVARNFV